MAEPLEGNNLTGNNMVTDIKTLFKSKQEEMANKMKTKLSHPGTQGDNTENIWLDFFRDYLPQRYACDKAFLIDSDSNLSQQIDIVVYDAHFSPFFFNYKNNKYIPAESAYAVFEVKPKLHAKNFKYAQRKIKSVRVLNRTSAPVLCNGEERPGREPFRIIGGLLTIDNEWEKKLTEQKINIDDKGVLDIGCCIHDKSWICRKNSEGIYEYKWNNENSLLAFFMAFLNELQKLGTVPAMEISKYYNGFSD